MTSLAKVRGSERARADKAEAALAAESRLCLDNYQTSVDSEIETVRDIRLEITPSPRLVTCGQCKASLGRDLREKVKAAQGEGK